MQYIPQRILKISYTYKKVLIENNKIKDIYVAYLHT